MNQVINLTTEESYNRHVKQLMENVLWFQAYEALMMVPEYEQYLADHPEVGVANPERLEVIRNLLIDNKWTALSMETKEVVLELFNKHLMPLFTMSERYDFGGPIDIVKDTFSEQLRYFLMKYTMLDERDAIKAEIVKSIITNQEQFTTAPFFGEIKSIPATVENWFKEYTTFMVPGAGFSEFQHSKFFKTSENVLRLNEVELARLHSLIELYKQLKLSSSTTEGMEESVFYHDDKVVGVVQYGEIIPYSKELQDKIREIMKQEELAASKPVPVSRPPIDQVHARPTVHPDIKGLDIDATKGPDYFDEKDQQDIARHEEKSQLLSSNNQNYTRQAEDLKHELQLVFQTPEVEKKFTDLLVSVLRGLRDVMELSGYLKELNYSAKQIDTISSTVKLALNGGSKAEKNQNQINLQAGARKPTLEHVAQQIKQSDHEEADQLPANPESALATEAATPGGIRKILLPKLRRSRRLKKPMIDDVKLQQSMVMGPLDELKAMDLIEFRRLSPNATEAATKIKDKIELLGEEAVSKQAEGVHAFKQSPINQQYLDIGNKSMASGKSMVDIINEMEAAGTPVLRVEEFNAIADLNKQIRF